MDHRRHREQPARRPVGERDRRHVAVTLTSGSAPRKRCVRLSTGCATARPGTARFWSTTRPSSCAATSPTATLDVHRPRVRRVFGSTSEELTGALLVDLRPASERMRVSSWLRSFATGDSVRTHVEREVVPDGSLRWYQWTHRAFSDDAGEIVEFQSVGHDITDQRRAANYGPPGKILEQVARASARRQLFTISRRPRKTSSRGSPAPSCCSTPTASLCGSAWLRPSLRACSSSSRGPRSPNRRARAVRPPSCASRSTCET